MSDLNDFVSVFREELIDDKVNEETFFKKHGNWSSLISLIIISEIDKRFGILIEVDHLKSAETISELYHLCSSET